MAADGLRGITYARDNYRYFSDTGKRVNVEFKLLKYQSRTGAVGTYWTALVGGELVDRDTGALTAEGSELANEFPMPQLMAHQYRLLADPETAHRVSMPIEDLSEWAETCHLVAARRAEHEQLGDALIADNRRECLSRALRNMIARARLPDVWDMPSLKRLRKELNASPTAVDLGLTTVIDGVLATERFHEAVLTVFQSLLWWGTMQSNDPLDDLLAMGDFRQATDRCCEMSLLLRQFRDGCDDKDIREAISGLASFASAIERATSARLVVDEILRRHHDVQSGKVDGGGPKRDWVALDGGKLLRPPSRFQRREPPPPALGKSLTHPYRLEPFIYMLRETGVLPRPK